jgi:hypothetical protein
MTTFNIGSQNAAAIQNVGGDMVFQGGIHATANLHLIELRGQLAQLRQDIERLELPAETRAAARDALAEAEAEAAAPAPRANRITRALRRVSETLNAAGVDVVQALAGAVSLVALLG